MIEKSRINFTTGSYINYWCVRRTYRPTSNSVSKSVSSPSSSSSVSLVSDSVVNYLSLLYIFFSFSKKKIFFLRKKKMSGFLQVAFDRFDSPDLLNVVHRWNIDLGEVKSLKLTSATIQVLYDEAEVKQLTSDPVKLWLEHLNQLLYDAEDILDEYATELLRLKLESKYHETHPHQTQQEFRRFGSQVRDINERLKDVEKEGVALGLNSRMGSGSSKHRVFSERPPTSSLVIPSKVFGRKEDADKIVEWLLTPSPSNSNDNNFSVQTIVGMGGSGKTTLAQLVYNHETVENSKYFDLKGWVCVSEDFHVVRLTKEILESVTGSSEPSNSLDILQMKLKEALNRKRFLLVLDMWNKDYERWDALSTAFAFGKSGSKILVTTRDKIVSSIVRTVSNDYDLKNLSDEDCLALFRRHAFMDRNSSDADRKLKAFGQKIVKKCKGLPLAVKTLAGVLRGKGEDSDWEDILENEIWGLENREILPSLMLSYHHLPPLLKRCFAYCALFPKDHVFDKIELIMLWMAEGFVQQPIKLKGKKREEDIGVEYFDELFMRSFFELSSNHSPYSTSPFAMPDKVFSSEVPFYRLSKELHMRSFFESSSNTGAKFVMHDLIHDLAQFVWHGLYSRRENYDNPSKVTTARHLSYFTRMCKFEATEFEATKSVRTLLHLICYAFPSKNLSPTMLQCQFQFLRVLRVKNYYCKCQFPDSIGKLKHLRLLDLSDSMLMKRLPNSITSLYNLQTLILIGCLRLRELPEDMGNLVNLRHLFLPQWGMDSCVMPLGVGTLTSLQTLTTFYVGSKSNRELRDLSPQLRGALEISNLENVGNINGTGDMVANLKNKQHLLGLRLCWRDYKSKDSFLDLGRDEKAEEDVLDQLQPHTNLEMLWIENYGGTRFPSWIKRPTFSNLTTMSLIGCHKCMFLPDLRQLPLLKHLLIKRCSVTKMVGSELHGDGSSSVNNQFRSLETLRIECMEEWEEWTQVVKEEKGEGQFPRLRELIVGYCPKLRMFTHSFPALVKLEMVRCDDLRELPRLLPPLQQLRIVGCPKVVVDLSCHPSLSSSSATSAPHLDNPFPCLREIEIGTCLNLRELPPILPSLESLRIGVCEEELCFLPTFPSIKKLELTKCKEMVSINNKTEAHHLSSLSSLTITDVSDLEWLPNGFMQHLTSLKKLNIFDCRELKVLLQNEIGSAGLLPPSLQLLHIEECDNLRKLPQSICNLYCLQRLKIEGARGLISLPEGLHTLTSLQEFVIISCHSLVSLPESGLPTTLQRLTISDCKNIESLHVGLLHNLTSLQLLVLSGCPKVKVLPKGLHNLTSLQRLEIIECPALASFPDKELIPTELSRLSIKKCGKLNFSPKELHKLTNLRELEIVGCSFLVDCKIQEPLLYLGLWNLTTTLQSLTIGGCPAIVSIPKGILPMNIREFYIEDCPNLESLPDGLSDLTSLEELVICNCPTLTRRCEEEEGVDWSQITQIPRVSIGEMEGIPPRVIELRSSAPFPPSSFASKGEQGSQGKMENTISPVLPRGFLHRLIMDELCEVERAA